MRIFKIFLFQIILSVTFPVLSANIYIFNKSFIKIEGNITNGDAEKLAKTMSDIKFVRAFIVKSNGGNVVEAIRMAKLIESSYAGLYVDSGAVCASACFFLFIGAQERVANGFFGEIGTNPTPEMFQKGRRFVGIHRPYFNLSTGNARKSIKKQEQLMSEVRNYLHQKDVPQYLIDEMMGRPSNNIYWLQPRDLDNIGEYTPGLEELYVKKCNYNKREIDILWTKSMVDNYISCTEDIWSREFLMPQLDYLDQLKEGWRPWEK